ncbi:pinin-like isoform X2 [Branchiostoma floridae x Branchiostoma belcheri]
MAVVVRSLQDQISKAKENLKGVDENIKKLIGRDPSDARPGAVGGPGRRVSLGGAGPGVGRGRGAGFRRESEDWGEGPAVKRRGEIGLGARDRRVVTYRGRGRGRGRRDEEDDEDELPHKPSLASSVIPTPTAKMTRKDSIDQLNKDEQSKKRNRRMFGMLMGTLQRFRTEEVSKQQQDKERRRSEIDKKLEEKVEEEKKAAAAERQVLFKERRAKQAELRKLEYKLELAQLQEEWDRHNAHLMQFIQVKASPALFWCPKKHSKETLQLLKDSQDRLKKVFDKRRKDLEEEISVMEVTTESGKSQGGAEPREGGVEAGEGGVEAGEGGPEAGQGGAEGKGAAPNVQDLDDLPEDTGIEIGEERWTRVWQRMMGRNWCMMGRNQRMLGSCMMGRAEVRRARAEVGRSLGGRRAEGGTRNGSGLSRGKRGTALRIQLGRSLMRLGRRPVRLGRSLVRLGRSLVRLGRRPVRLGRRPVRLGRRRSLMLKGGGKCGGSRGGTRHFGGTDGDGSSDRRGREGKRRLRIGRQARGRGTGKWWSKGRGDWEMVE